MELISNYTNALQAIYDHVDFEEKAVVYPIDDATNYYWTIDKSVVNYADSIEELNNDDYYIDYIRREYCYKKSIYEGEKFTMIFCDVDGIILFKIFDNSKRL